MFCLVLGIWSLVIPCSSAYALSINIDPSNIHITLKPGASNSQEILIQNLSSEKIKIRSYAEDWIYAPDGSKIFMKPGSSAYSCSSWIKLEQEKFELAPKEGKKVKFTISSPSNASGGFVSVIFFEAVIEKYEGIAVSGRIGTIVYVDTEGDNRRAGEIKDFSALTSEEGKPLMFNISFNNKGNSYINARSNIKITDNGKTVLETRASDINTLPGDTKASTLSINKTLKEGNYSAQVELSFDDKTLRSQTNFKINKSPRK